MPRVVLWWTTLDLEATYGPVVYNVGLEGLISSYGVKRWTERPHIVLWYKTLVWKASYRLMLFDVGLEGLISSCGV